MYAFEIEEAIGAVFSRRSTMRMAGLFQRMNVESCQKVRRHFSRIEKFFGDAPRGGAMARQVALDILQRFGRLVHGRPRAQTIAGWQHFAPAGFLEHDGSSQREVARAPVAEPTAARQGVALLRDGELTDA